MAPCDLATLESANQRMHVSRLVEFIGVVSRSRRPRDPNRSGWMPERRRLIRWVAGGYNFVCYLMRGTTNAPFP
jgi:hypothetical protein